MNIEALIEQLTGAIEPEQRKTIMRQLVEMKDPRATATFRAALDSDDEDIRAIAATGLFQLGTEDALQACLKTIDDSPDMLHFEVTPSVRALTKMGLPALSSVLPLLDAENEETRRHAQKVLEQVTFDEIAKDVTATRGSPPVMTEWETLWKNNGPYQWNAPADQRRAAIERWKQWIESR